MVEKMKKVEKSPTGKGESTRGKTRFMLHMTRVQHSNLKAKAERECQEKGYYISMSDVIRQFLDGLQA
jgi:hypothetical protein